MRREQIGEETGKVTGPAHLTRHDYRYVKMEISFVAQ